MPQSGFLSRLSRSLGTSVLAAATLALAACGGGGDDIAYGDLLRRGISVNPDTVDPHKASGQWENIVIGDMFEGLYITNKSGEAVLGAAASASLDETQTVWTFELKEATWSDGEPVTADDFVFAFRRLQNPETAAQYASLLWVVKNARAVNQGDLPPEALGIRAIDARTLEIELEYPAPYLPGLLSHYASFPVPRHVVEAHGDAWVRPENIEVNGPYKLVDWTVGSSLVAVKNPAWEGSEALCFDSVAYLPIVDNAAVERAIEAGELDTNNSFEGARMAEIEERLPGWVRTDPSLTTTYWVYDTTQPPFDDLRVRRALSMALDREYMVENVLTPGYVPAYSFVPPGIANYVPEDDQPRLDWAGMDRAERLVEARALLEEAGYGPDRPLRFEFIYRNSGDAPKTAPVALSNWSEIADWVQPELLMQDTKVLYSRLRQKDFQFSDAGWVADFNDPHNFLYLLETDTGQMNYGSYSNAEFDRLLTESNTELDLERRGRLLAEAEATMLADEPLAPMFFSVNRNLVDPELTGWEDNVLDVHRSRYLCRPGLE